MTKNEEKNIRRCLESLTWCDEIVVLDSGSTDETVKICEEYTDQVHHHEWLGYIGQRNILRKYAKYDWVLFLDADEEVSKELKDQLERIFCDSSILNIYRGFKFPRRVFYLDRWIKHGEWNPDVKLRLFRKDYGYSGGQEPHDQVLVDGLVKKLSGKLLHYTYENLTDHISTTNRFSTISAQAMYNKGRRFRLTDLLVRPPFRFFKGFFLKLGFLDGVRGFIIAVVNAFGVVMKYSKLREIEWQENRRKDAPSKSEPSPSTTTETGTAGAA